MQGADPDAVELLSRDRLEGFRHSTADTDKLLVGRYLLNAAVTEALHPLLHALEVVLRNRIHNAASARYPVDRDLPHTYVDYPSWLDAIPARLVPSHQGAIDSAKDQVFRELRRRFGMRRASDRVLRTPGRLVAALPLSFWVYMFDTDYSGDRSAPGLLWPDLLPQVFPHAERPSIKMIRKRLRRLLVVRNRSMHYERIYPYEDGKGVAWDPWDIRSEVLDLLHWMSPRAAAVVERFDRIPEVLHPANERYLRWLPWLV